MYKQLIIFIALYLTAVNVLADNDFYIQGNVGGSSISENPEPVYAIDKSGQASKLVVGSKVTKNWSLDATYFDYGIASWKVTATSEVIESRSYGYGLMATYTQDFGDGLFLKGGLGVANIRSRVAVSTTHMQDSWQPTLSVGVGYKFKDNFSLVLDHDRSKAKHMGHAALGSQAGTTFSLSMTTFGLRVDY